jgi:hypothetical protein
MAKFIRASSSDAHHVTRRRPESTIEQLELGADRKISAIYQKDLAKILDGSCTKEDFEHYTEELKRATDRFTKSCINSLRRPE